MRLPSKRRNRTPSDTGTYTPAPRQDDEPASWWTPFLWADDAGVYYGKTDAWLYLMLSADVLSSDGIAALCEHLHHHLLGREIHLITHAWAAPADTLMLLGESRTRLDQYLADTLTLHCPTRRLLLGIRLRADTSSTRTSGLADDIDRMLGEHVPDSTQFEADYTFVCTTLAPFGAQPPDTDTRDYLETWYTHGVYKDVTLDETDTSIDTGGLHTIVAATARPVTTLTTPATGTPAPIVGATVTISVRGTISSSRTGTPAIGDASIVLARRAPITTPWLTELSLVLPAARTSPLPLRQLPALDETLPCSTTRTNPLPEPVDAMGLTAVGFSDPRPAADKNGLLIGMAGIHYTDPIAWNPYRVPGNTLHIVGSRESGKTFLAEHVAHQGLLAGMTVRYLSGDAQSGQSLVGAGVSGWSEPYAGMCDPGTQPDTSYPWWKLIITAVAASTPAVDVNAYEQVLERHINRRSLPSLVDIPAAIYDPKSSSLAQKASRTTHSFAWATIGRDKTRHGPPSGSAAWSIPHLSSAFLAEFGEQAAIIDALAAAAVLTDTPDGSAALIVLDAVATGPLTTAAIAAASAAGKAFSVIMVHTDTGTVAAGRPASADTVVITETTQDRDGANDPYTWAGIDTSPILKFCWPTRAQIDDSDAVTRAATAVLRDHIGKVTPIVIAPVGPTLLPALCRNRHAHYLKRS